MNIVLLEIGHRLSARRKQMNMTQDALAEKANVTAQTISYAELGKRAMRADTIVGVCNALKISSDYLLFGDIPPTVLSELHPQISKLSPEQHCCLENIITNFIIAVVVGEEHKA